MSRDTWFTGHALDKQAFFQALSNVVHSSGFNADAMGAYMKTKVRLTLHDSVDRLVQDAWAVVEYLEAIGERA